MFGPGFPGGSAVRNLPANVGGLVRSLGQEDPQEKEMGNFSSILAWEISWRSLAGYSPWGCERVVYDLTTKQQQHMFCLQMRKLKLRDYVIVCLCKPGFKPMRSDSRVFILLYCHH